MNETKSTMFSAVAPSTKPYIKRVKRNSKPWIPEHGHIHRSFEFAFDPGDFVCDPSEIILRVVDHGFAAGWQEDEVELDSR